MPLPPVAGMAPGDSTANRSMPLTCRCARTDAGGALGREAVDAATVASGARIKPGEPPEALHREPLDAVPRPSTCPRWHHRTALGNREYCGRA
jgi:hypothetical protein